MGHIVACFILGMVFGGLQLDILTKPISLCLLGYRSIPRRFIFWVGGVSITLCSLIILAYPNLARASLPIVLAAAISFGMAVYSLGVWAALRVRKYFQWVLPMSLIFIWAGFGEMRYRYLERTIFSQPILIIVMTLPAIVWLWRWLGRDQLQREYSGKTLIAIRIWEAKKGLSSHSMKVEDFFLTMMKQCSDFGAARYACGMMYARYGTFIKPRIILETFFVWLLVNMASCYLGPFITILVAIYLCMTFINKELSLRSSLLLPAGRHQRFIAALTASLTITSLLAAFYVFPWFYLRLWAR